MSTYYLLLNIIVCNATIALLQHLLCLVDFAFTDKPPGGLWDKKENECGDSYHRPLIPRYLVSFDRDVTIQMGLSHLSIDWGSEIERVRGIESVQCYRSK